MAVVDLVLDPSLRYWVLLPIPLVMFLVGIIRHYGTILLQGTSKAGDIKTVRQQQYLSYGSILRASSYNLSPSAFSSRVSYYSEGFKKGEYLADPNAKGGAPNPLADPKGMESMIGMVKSQIMVFVPQTLMMGWINAFFAGFVLMKLPFPLTVQFKQMLQSGVNTSDLDVRWVSSISWYLINMMGLQPIYSLVLGGTNQAGGISSMAGPNPAQMMQPGVDYSKLFSSEAESLELTKHVYILDDVEDRLLAKYERK